MILLPAPSSYHLFLITFLDLHKILDHLHNSVITDLAAVHAEIVALGIAPALTGIIVIVTGTFLSGLDHDILRLGLRNLMAFLKVLIFTSSLAVINTDTTFG